MNYLDFTKKMILFINNGKYTKAQLAGIYAFKIQKYGTECSPKEINQALIDKKSIKYLDDVKTIAWGVLEGLSNFNNFKN